MESFFSHSFCLETIDMVGSTNIMESLESVSENRIQAFKSHCNGWAAVRRPVSPSSRATEFNDGIRSGISPARSQGKH